MKTLVAFPGTGAYAQQIALALHEHGALAGFSTTLSFYETGAISRYLPQALRGRFLSQLRRRALPLVPNDRVERKPLWELCRIVAQRISGNRIVDDRLWDISSHAFTRSVARRLERGDCAAVYAYEYTALEAFARAHVLGVARVLDLPSLSSASFRAIEAREIAAFPEMRDPCTAYFEKRFPERQLRRNAEIEAADVIVTNSTITARSHIERGADASKIVTIPLAAPPPVNRLSERSDRSANLRVVWAGSFILRKGAHYLLEALRAIPEARHVECDVYGWNGLPNALLNDMPEGLRFHGPVAQDRLFRAFDNSDVLIFPTLSDGFGLVVVEAFARGLPVITTQMAGAADLLRHEENGLVIDAGSSRAIEAAIRWCLDNRESLAAMRHIALATAASWQWQDYRRTFIAAVGAALERAGYAPCFTPAVEAG